MEKAKFDAMKIIDFLLESVEEKEFNHIVRELLEALWDIKNDDLCALKEGTAEYKEISDMMNLIEELIKLL
jgi:hypothetical protein